MTTAEFLEFAALGSTLTLNFPSGHVQKFFHAWEGWQHAGEGPLEPTGDVAIPLLVTLIESFGAIPELTA